MFPKSLILWLGREDSNLRIAESKSAALPLGDAPTCRKTSQARGKRADNSSGSCPSQWLAVAILQQAASRNGGASLAALRECRQIGVGAADEDADALLLLAAGRRRWRGPRTPPRRRARRSIETSAQRRRCASTIAASATSTTSLTNCSAISKLSSPTRFAPSESAAIDLTATSTGASASQRRVEARAILPARRRRP